MLDNLKEQQYGFVYLINAESTQEYKLGMSKADPLKRVKQLQTAHKNKLILVYTIKSKHYNLIEKTIHKLYSRYNNGLNEWFEFPNEIVQEVIAKMKELSSIDNAELIRQQGNVVIYINF